MKAGRGIIIGLGLVLLVAGAGYFVWRGQRAAQWRAEVPWPAALTADRPGAGPLRAAWTEAAQWPVRREAVERLVTLYLANGFQNEAAQLLPGIIARRPEAPEWVHRRAVLLADEGRLQEAVTLWQGIRAATTAHLPVRVKLADALMKLNREAEAVALYRELLVERPGYPHAWYGLIQQQVRQQRWAEARTALADAIAAAPDFYGHYALLETVARHQGDEAAAATADQNIKRLGRFRAVPDPWVEPAVADCYDPYRLRVDADRLRGDAEHAAGGAELSAALARVERAITLEPSNALNYQLLATLQGIRGDEAAAERAYGQGLALDPRSVTLALRYANLLARQGRPADERALLERVAQQCPDDADLAVRLADLLARGGFWREAAPHYRRAVQLRSDQPDLAIRAALASFRAGDEPAGLALLQENLRRFPRHEETLGYLVMNAVRQGDAPTAQALLARLLAVAPASAATARLRTLVQDRFGNPPSRE